MIINFPKEIRSNFPKEIRSNFKGYSNFIELLRLLQENSDTNFKIDFKNTEIFEANLSAILGAIIDTVTEQKKIVEYVDIHKTIQEIFELNDFLKSPKLNLNTDHKESVISYMKFTQYKDIE